MAGKSPSATSGLKRLPIYTSRTVAGTIKKFDATHDSTEMPTIVIPKKEVNSQCKSKHIINNHKFSNNNHVEQNNDINKIKICSKLVTKHDDQHFSKVEKIVEKLSNIEKTSENNTLTTTTVRYRCPSPSLLRKTQAVIAKEQCNEYYMAKQALKSPTNTPNLTPKSTSNKVAYHRSRSPLVNKKDKPKSESYQKAAAFWNSPKA